MYIGMRWMTATDLATATAAATEIAKHLNDERGWRAAATVSVTGPANRIGFFGFHDSMSDLLDKRASLADDARFGELMQKAAGAFEPSSGTDYILRVLHRTPDDDGTRNFIYFRSITAEGTMTEEMTTAAIQLAQHLVDVHGARTTVGTYVGGDGDGVLIGTSFETGDDIERLGDALRADEMMQKLSATIGEHASGFSDRIVRILR